jgi:predicted molibdopterin-dependent oxidoreductase YjgC
MPLVAAGRRKAKVIVVDHVRTSLCDLSGARAMVVPPGTEGLVIRGMIRTILEEGWWDRPFVEARTEGIESLRQAVAPYDLAFVAERTGLDPEDLQASAKEFAQAAKACILMGLETLTLGDAVDLARAAACLALVTAKVGKPGCGLHLYAERANSQGALDMGLVPGLLPGYLSPEDPEARKRFEDVWRSSIPAAKGLDAKDILQGCREGGIRSLYIVGENPMGTYPDRRWVGEALSRVEFLVVQEIFPTETALMAHVVLPVANFAEKRGTFTSVDRRIQGIDAALVPPPGVRSDLEVFGALIQAMGWPYPHEGPDEILEEIGRLVPLYEGIRREDLPAGGLSWPLTRGEGGLQGTALLYEEDFPHGRARLELGPWEEKEPEGDPQEFPLILSPRALWFHNGTFSTWSPSLMEVCPSPRILLHEEDARTAGLKEGDRARVVTPRGVVEGEVRIQDRGPKGVVQVPYHFPDQPVNALVDWEGRPVRARVEGAA